MLPYTLLASLLSLASCSPFTTLSPEEISALTTLELQKALQHPHPSVSHQSPALAGLPLLGNDGCFNFALDNGHKFSAFCIGSRGQPVSSTVDLDLCVLGMGGQLGFLSHPGFSDKCQNCELDVETLDFTCNCETAPGHDVFETSTINLDGTKVPNGNGVFVYDDGHLGCRAPFE